jgi:hypothetical protein
MREARTRDQGPGGRVSGGAGRPWNATGAVRGSWQPWGLRLPDPQVPQQALKRLLVGVVLLPAGEVIEAVAKPAGQL